MANTKSSNKKGFQSGTPPNLVVFGDLYRSRDDMVFSSLPTPDHFKTDIEMVILVVKEAKENYLRFLEKAKKRGY